MQKKNFRICMRFSETVLRKLLAISGVSGKSRTAVIEDLILGEFGRNKKYLDRYYEDLNKPLVSKK